MSKTSGYLIPVLPNNTSQVSGGLKKTKNAQLPAEMRPRTVIPMNQYPTTTAAPKVSVASQWAADFYRTEKRMQMEDEHAEAIANMTGSKSASQLAVRNVFVTNVPGPNQIRKTGINAELPHNPTPNNPLPKDTARPPGIPLDIKPITGKRKGDKDHGGSNKRQNVASLNPLTNQISLTDTTNIQKMGNDATGESKMPGAYPGDVPDFK
ncbi:hypothetical protein HDV00_000873, partial [Rhizophlyctis rosea]